jgi:futalosine hydrolase
MAMRVLIVSATVEEVAGCKLKVDEEVVSCKLKVAGEIEGFGLNVEGENAAGESQTMDYGISTINFLTTGVGMVATAFALGTHLATNSYDLAINLGIAGSFDRNIALGEVREITEDILAELGAEDGEDFITIDKLGFGVSSFGPTYQLLTHFNLKQATAVTVNTVHGNEVSIKKLSSRVNAQLESMEGAAFFYACRQAGIPCMQIRAVSNYVEKRNRDNWQIGLAIKNLNTFAFELLKGL